MSSSVTSLQNRHWVCRSGGPLAGRYDTVQSHGLSHFNQLSQTQLEQAYQRFRKEYQKPIQFKYADPIRFLEHYITSGCCAYSIIGCRIISTTSRWIRSFWDG